MAGTIFLISLLAALLAALGANHLLAGAAERINQSGAFRMRQAERAVAEEERLLDSLGRFGRLFGRWTPQGVLDGFRRDLYWMHFTGHPLWGGRSEYSILGRQIFFTLTLGILFQLIAGSGAAFLFGAVAGWQLATSGLRNAVTAVRERIALELPEFVQLMSAEAGGGLGLDAVLLKVSQGTSLVAAWFRHVVEKSAGASLISHPDERLRRNGQEDDGWVAREARRSGHPELIALANQLAFVRGGVNVADLLEQLAAQFKETFVARAEIRAEQLAVTMSIYIGIFYVFPYMIALIVVIGIPLLKAFQG